MGGLSRLIQNSILDVIVGRASSFSTSGAVWAQLHTGGSPGTNGTSNVATGFSRQQVSFGTYANRKILTSSAIVFANFPYQESGSPYVSFWDAESGGNFIGADQATPPSVIEIGQSWTIPSGQLEIGVGAGHASDALAQRALETAVGAASFVGSGEAPYLQLHTGEPGVNGTDNVATVYGVPSNVTGRMQTPTWPTAASGGIVISDAPPGTWGWEVRGQTSVQLGITTFWDAATNGNYLGKRGSILSNPFWPGDRFLYMSAVPSRFSFDGSF